LLEGRYDCVDRLVVNAYFAMGQTGGGMRAWWRRLHGDDSKLDNNHLRDMAGTFSRRIHAFCDKHGTPLVEAHAGERKHELAPSVLERQLLSLTRVSTTGAHWVNNHA